MCPDNAARLMRGVPSPVVGCILLNLANAFYADMSRGIEDGLRALGLLALIGSSDVDHEREIEYLRLMESQRVRGVILTPTDAIVEILTRRRANRRTGREISRELGGETRSFPIVLADHPRGGLDLCAVTADHEQGGYLLARHLIDLGHRRLTLVWPQVDVQSLRLRERGVRRACAEDDQPVTVDLVRLPDGRDGEPLDESFLRRASHRRRR